MQALKIQLPKFYIQCRIIARAWSLVDILLNPNPVLTKQSYISVLGLSIFKKGKY